jgi:hypothetical protein
VIVGGAVGTGVFVGAVSATGEAALSGDGAGETTAC